MQSRVVNKIQLNILRSKYSEHIYLSYFLYIHKNLFTHKAINTYINGVVKICLNKFFFENTGFQKKRERCNSFNKIQ